MKGYISGIDFVHLTPMKYWSFTAKTSDAEKKRVVMDAVLQGQYLGALKVDGYYERFVKDEDGNCFMIAREINAAGEVTDKWEWVPHLHSWLEAMPNGSCFLCEVYLPGNEGSKNVTSILGCGKDKAIARQESTPLHVSVFDCMAYNGISLLKTPYERRTDWVRKIAEIAAAHPYVTYVEFYEGAELWSKIQEFLAEGREGAVIMRKDAIVYQKRTPARVSIKVKKELRETVDCFFTGRTSAPTEDYTGKEIATWRLWQNTYTGEFIEGDYYRPWREGQTVRPVTKSFFHGWAGSLEIGVMRDGAVYPIGWLSNLPEEMKSNPAAYAMRPIEVTAMEIDLSNGFSLRHGKMLQFRDDLTPAQCTYEKIMEEI